MTKVSEKDIVEQAGDLILDAIKLLKSTKNAKYFLVTGQLGKAIGNLDTNKGLIARGLNATISNDVVSSEPFVRNTTPPKTNKKYVGKVQRDAARVVSSNVPKSKAQKAVAKMKATETTKKTEPVIKEDSDKDVFKVKPLEEIKEATTKEVAKEVPVKEVPSKQILDTSKDDKSKDDKNTKEEDETLLEDKEDVGTSLLDKLKSMSFDDMIVTYNAEQLSQMAKVLEIKIPDNFRNVKPIASRIVNHFKGKVKK